MAESNHWKNCRRIAGMLCRGCEDLFGSTESPPTPEEPRVFWSRPWHALKAPSNTAGVPTLEGCQFCTFIANSTYPKSQRADLLLIGESFDLQKPRLRRKAHGYRYYVTRDEYDSYTLYILFQDMCWPWRMPVNASEP